MEVDKLVADNSDNLVMATISSKLKKSKSTPFNRSLVLAKPIKSSWKKKMELKNEKRNVKAIEKNLKVAKQALIDENRRRREENQKRREENTKKAEIVQKITNIKKIGKKGVKRVRKAV